MELPVGCIGALSWLQHLVIDYIIYTVNGVIVHQSMTSSGDCKVLVYCNSMVYVISLWYSVLVWIEILGMVCCHD